MDNLPEGVKTHGINKYYGAQGVRNPLIPPPDESTDKSFMASLLHRVLCGFLRELLVYTTGRPDAPRPVALGPSLIEGTCGRIKRIVKEQGNLKIRDFCIRAKVAAKEEHLHVDREPAMAVESMVRAFMATHIETNYDRKHRLRELRLQLLEKHNKMLAKRVLYRSKRSEYLARITIRFDTDETWPRPLLVQQAEARGFKSCQVWKFDSLIQKIRQWEEEQPRETLHEFLAKRKISGAHSKAQALRKLREHDNKEANYPLSARVHDGGGEEIEEESDDPGPDSETSSEEDPPSRKRKRKEKPKSKRGGK
jgi:hypothetical protein